MNLTEKQAYIAMIYYLENLYELTKSDDLGAFLGGMMLLEDGYTADPASWDDWQKAVQKAFDAAEIPALRITGPAKEGS